jgi:hypothetical protein
MNISGNLKSASLSHSVSTFEILFGTPNDVSSQLVTRPAFQELGLMNQAIHTLEALRNVAAGQKPPVECTLQATMAGDAPRLRCGSRDKSEFTAVLIACTIQYNTNE